MKRTLLTLFMLWIGVASFAQGAIIEMDSVSHNFGEVSRKGADIVHTFTARNIGTSPLVITEVSTTCTCIKAKYPKRPIPPQESGEITVRYEVQRKEVGRFYKVLKVLSNATNSDQVLTISGISVEKP